MSLFQLLITALILITLGTISILYGRRRKTKWPFLLAGCALIGFVVSALLHNFLSALLKIEEPVFFITAVLICPFLLTAGLLGMLVVFVQENLLSRRL